MQRNCPRCGARLASEAVAGSPCPQCLLRLGFETEAADPRAGTTPERIGPYKILHPLGEGGMGIVYLAEQTEPVRRRVALKLIKLGMDTRQVLARFEAERQALAIMNHPNVAKVFDAGATEQGRPYFVMEYVPGVPITEFCDLKCLSLRERLTLFMKTCEAIQHAHQKGIIHRDIKPSNVLVGSEGGKPQLKVIDFGVAKAASQKLTERTLFTQHGILLGTPEYMSPEQAGTTALDVDTRTDIYSLGVLLYELLVGALPFDPDTLRRAAAVEMLRVIREEDPPKPTTRFQSLGDTAREVARQRHTDVRSLARQLRGELEWITMRALEKDPARRYASASELALDIRRHAEGEPVLAGPPGAAYRIKKFFGRHRIPVTAAAAVLLALSAGLVTSTWLYGRAERARVRAEAEAERIRLEARAGQAALAEDFEGYLEYGRRALARHRQALEEDDPALATHLVNYLGTALLVGWEAGVDDDDVPAGTLDEWRVLADEAYQRIRRALAEDRADLLETADLLAAYFSDPPDGLESLSERAEQLYRQTLELRLRRSDPADPALLANRENLARFLMDQGNSMLVLGSFPEAEPRYREAIELLRVTRPAGDRGRAVAECHLGSCLTELGRFEEAEALLTNAYRSLEGRLDAASATWQMVLSRIVDLYSRWGKPNDAARYRELLPEVSIKQFVEPDRVDVDGHHGGAFSAGLDGRSLWVFRGIEPGSHVPANATTVAALWATSPAGAAGLLPDASRPLPLLPWTPAESAYNLDHGEGCLEDCGSHWALEPGPVVADADNDRALVFYTKAFSPDRGPFAEQPVGTSIAVLERSRSTASRPRIGRFARHPTLMFGDDEPRWTSAALIANGFLYVYGPPSDVRPSSCLLARVETSRLFDRDSWRFYAGNGRWRADWRRARPVLKSVPSRFSVHWNAFLGKFLAVHSQLNRIVLRTADRPEGPWSEPAAAIEVEAPSDGWCWFGVGHPHLARDGGRVEYLTYYRPTRFLGGEVRLIEVVLGRPGV